MPPTRPETKEIPLRLIKVGEQQIRDCPDDESIGELAESIASKGLLQAIGVSTSADGSYQLRWGHRRLLAHQRLGRKTILATIYTGAEESVKAIALIENLHRSQMSLQEEIDAVEFLEKQEGKSVSQIAQILSKGRTWVLNRLMVKDLPDFLSDPLLAGDLPVSHVEIISKVPDEGARRYLAGMAVQMKWNKSQLRQIAEAYMIAPEPAPAPMSNTPGVSPNPGNAVFLYSCQICGEKGSLDQFDLVRVHKDGAGCRSDDDRSNSESSRDNGLESHLNRHRSGGLESDDRETQAEIAPAPGAELENGRGSADDPRE